MNKLIRTSFISLLILASCSQKTSGNASNSQEDDCIWNDSNEYALCISKLTNSKGNNPPATKYQVLDKENSVIEEGTLDNGEVKWLDDNAIEIVTIPGNISEDLSKDDYTKVYIISEDKFVTKKAYLEMQ